MESLQIIKQRMRGVQNISQITKAMELVAATKMRKSQEIALASRPFAFTALDLLAKLSKMDHGDPPKLLAPREIKTTLFLLITSDKGLAGPFNNEIIHRFDAYLHKEKIDTRSAAFAFVAVGQKAHDYLTKKAALQKTFTRVGDFTTPEQVRPLASFIIAGYLENRWDRVLVFSTQFVSALRQKPMMREIFPVTFQSLKKTAEDMIPETGKFAEMIRGKKFSFFEHEKNAQEEYLIEPSPKEALDALIPFLVEMQIYHLILETNASEHAARRAAMKSASDNAEELGERLGLSYNKSRQAAITRELIEISAGAESLQ